MVFPVDGTVRGDWRFKRSAGGVIESLSKDFVWVHVGSRHGD
jgi:hypothetical protein